MPLLQRAGILYRRPLRDSKRCTKSFFYIWAKEGHLHTYTHSYWAPKGHTCTTANLHHKKSLGEWKEHRYIILNNHGKPQLPHGSDRCVSGSPVVHLPVGHQLSFLHLIFNCRHRCVPTYKRIQVVVPLQSIVPGRHSENLP